MAAVTMATAAGAVMILYFILNRRLLMKERDEADRSDKFSKSNRSGRRRLSREPAQPPTTWFQAISTLSETLRYTYSETLGKWPIGDLTFGINYLMRRQGNLQVARLYAGSRSIQLKGSEIATQLKNLLRLLTLCMFFSKKPFPLFLEASGYSPEDVLLQEPKAGLLKPAFTIIRDKRSKCFLLLIRGTHSIKDTLTAATGAVVPFHHSVLHEGGVSNLVLGYAHCGMVAAARWIAKLTIPCLLGSIDEHPDYRVKIVGHSLGGGTAALLTYILREHERFSSTTCIAFAPAACMTWDLAESGKSFITAIINGSDLVPTFSAASVDDLRSEVTASSWLNDLRDRVGRTRFLNAVYRSASVLGSRLPSIASARARVAGAGAFLRPVSSSTQIVMKRAQNVAQAVVRSRSSFSSWSCMGRQRPANFTNESSKEEEDEPKISLLPRKNSETFAIESNNEGLEHNILDFNSLRESEHELTEEEDDFICDHQIMDPSRDEDITQRQLWLELNKEIPEQVDEVVQVREDEMITTKEIKEERNKDEISFQMLETHRFYPPGKILHMISLSPMEEILSENDNNNSDQTIEKVGIFETPRDLYNKLRLSKTMVNDHYMPMYKKMMELLIETLEKDSDGTSCMLTL